MGKFIDLTGQKFGRLTVIERADNTKQGQAKWLCQCDCGRKTVVMGKSLRNGNTKSCGCLQKETIGYKRTIHGQTNTRFYRIWCGMKSRCYNKKNPHFHLYGGRGIKVCNEWLKDFQTFYDWAIANGYADNLTLDRINVNGNYEPSNCRWITRKEQNNNKRAEPIIIFAIFCSNTSISNLSVSFCSSRRCTLLHIFPVSFT